MTFGRGPLVFHGLAIIAGVAGAFLTTQPIEKQPDLSGSIAEDGPIESRAPDLPEFARTTPAAEFAAVIESLHPSENPWRAHEAWEAIHLLCRRWIEHDPDGLLVFATRDGDFDRDLALVCFREWLDFDTTGAFAALERVADAKSRKALKNFAATELAHLHPERFLEIQGTLQEEPESLSYYRGIAILTLAERDPEKAIPLLDQVERSFRRDETIRTIAEVWGRKDPEAAAAWAETLDSPANRQEALASILFELAETDLEAASRLIRDFGVGSSRSSWDNSIYGEIAKTLAATDARRSMDWIIRFVPEALQSSAAQQLVRDANHPDLAIALLDAMPPGPARRLAISNRFGNWSTGDPKIAWDWIRENMPPSERKWVLDRLAQKVGEANFENAWEFAESLRQTPEETAFRHQVIAGLGKYDLERARRIARELGDPDLRNLVVAEAVSKKARSDGDPAELAALLSELPANYPFRDPPHFSIGTDWMKQDSAAALAWAQSLPIGTKAREKSLDGIANTWTREDPAAAWQWFAALPPGSDRDIGFDRISKIQRGKNDYPGAFSAALEISAQSSREGALGRVVQSWMKRDPDAAWNAVETSSLETAAKERLFRQFRLD